MPRDRSKRDLFTPGQIAVLYALIGLTWIFFTDRLIELAFDTVHDSAVFSVIKGSFYVLVTSLLLYFLVRSSNRRLQTSQRSAREQDQVVRAITHNSPVEHIRCRIDQSGLCETLYSSAGYITLLGLEGVDHVPTMTMEELLGLFEPEGRVEAGEAIRRAMEDQRPFRVDLCRRLQSGEHRWLRYFTTTHMDDDGAVIFDGVVFDITEQKGTEQQMRDANAELSRVRDRLVRLLDAAVGLQSVLDEGQALQVVADAVRGAGWDGVAVNLFDEDWAITFDAYAGLSPERIADLRSRRADPERRRAMFGPEREPFRVSRSYFIPEERVEAVSSIVNPQVGSRTPQRGDTWRPRDLAYVPMTDRAGRVVGRITIDDPVDGQRPDGMTLRYVETFADLAMRTIENIRLQRMSEKQHESERRLALHIQRSPLGLVGWDRDQRVVEWNDASQRIFGYSAEEALGRRFWELIIPEHEREVVRSAVDQMLDNAQPTEVTNDNLTKSGKIITCEWRNTPLTDSSGRTAYVLSMASDITERRLSQEQLRRSVETRGLLLAELDHRVRNALGNLLTMIDLSADSARTIPDFASAIRSRVETMARVHAMLSEARWEGVGLAELIGALRPPECLGDLRAEGPAVSIPARQASPLGMIVQELVSNSLKHGALGAAGGIVDVGWDINDDAVLSMSWMERGGPPIVGDPTRGVGTGLIEGFARFELRGDVELRYHADGVHHTITMRLDDQTSGGEHPSLEDTASREYT
ncbi:MAG: PAS domain S-box protein [Planctomycetota bacterium]